MSCISFFVLVTLIRFKSSLGCGERIEIVQDDTNFPGIRFAQLGSHPWHAGIYRMRGDRPYILICSGTLIYNDIILTTASCLIDSETQLTILASALAVSLGKLSKDLHTDEAQQQRFEVSKIVVNSKYDGFYKRFSNNLALVKLKQGIIKSHFVKTVCLWTQKSLPKGVTKGCIVGWGLQFSEGFTLNLKEANSELINVQTCIRNFHDALYRIYITNDKFCMVLDQGVGIREPDQGGPVTIHYEGRHYLYGIISKPFGMQYGLATLTSKQINWIKSTTYTLKHEDDCTKADHFNCINDGTCISATNVCDGTNDCKDASDEDSKYCTESNSLENTIREMGKRCLMPERVEIFTVLKCSEGTSCSKLYSAPSNSKYQITCPEGYGFASPDARAVPIVCNDGEWTPSLEDNQCLKLCKLEGDRSLDLTCTYLGEELSCNELLKPNTQITVECKRQFKKKKLVNYISKTYCRRDGIINNELSPCEPVCGKPFDLSNTQTLISNGKPLKYAKYPWHVALYWKESVNGMLQYEYKCGGSLIDSNKVLTAAHCVWIDQAHRVFDAKLMGITTGKLYRNWTIHPEEIWVQRAGVSRVIVASHYDGASSKYSHDIAVLILNKNIKLSDNTMPACLDLDLSAGGVPSDQLGHVIGWGSTSGKQNSPSDILMETWMYYLDLDSCRKKFNRVFADFLHPDKYCALTNNGSAVQAGDSGGGMTFVHDGLHYVYGIISLKKQGQDEFAVFTNILYKTHADWLANILDTQ